MEMFDPKKIWASVRRRWLTATALGLLGAVLTAISAYLLIPAKYTATAELHLRSASGPYENAANRNQASYKQSVIHMVRSPAVIKQVLRINNVSKLSFVQSNPDPALLLEEMISVSSAGADYMSISIASRDPSDLAVLVNAVADTLIRVVQDRETKEAQRAIAALESSSKEVETKLTEWRRGKERLVQKMGSAKDGVAEAREAAREEFYADLRRNSMEAKIRKTKLLAQLRLMDRARENPTEAEKSRPELEATIESLIDSQPELVALTGRLAREEQALKTMEKTVGRKATLDQMRTKIEATREELAAARPETENRLREELSKRDELNSRLSEADIKTQVELADIEVELYEKQIEREDVNRSQNVTWSAQLEELQRLIDNYDTLLNNYQTQLENRRAALAYTIRLEKFRDAVTPQAPNSKLRYAGTGLSALATFLMIAAGIVFLDLRTMKINTLDEIVKTTGLPIIGSLPIIPTNQRSGKGSAVAGAANQGKWQGALIESVNSARVMLVRRAELDRSQVFMVASAMTSEGKTTVCSHLATSLARAGYRVVIVDGDLRRPTIHRVFGVKADPGVCSLLEGKTTLSESIQPTSQEGLFVVSAGTLTSGALRKLSQEGIPELVAQLRQEFDFVMIDSSPVLSVTDGLVLAQHVDGVLMSLRRDVSQHPRFINAYQR
ncbi:MAG: polysaccharide biosynthesis tyrosine autokinase, partial [Planctomycetaceae bacterium]